MIEEVQLLWQKSLPQLVLSSEGAPQYAVPIVEIDLTYQLLEKLFTNVHPSKYDWFSF